MALVPASPWDRLAPALPPAARGPWLETLLARNAHTTYSSQHGSPRDQESFRARVPIVSHEDLLPYLDAIQHGQTDVLFAGRPIAYERTAGSSGGAKLIPYSSEGLEDFRRALIPWLVESVQRHGVTGRAYLSISPATRKAEMIGDTPVGLSDGAYLGAPAATILAELTAVPLDVAAITDVVRWRAETLRYLAAAADLELISCWSPTFLLRLLYELPNPTSLWPRLKLVSCWAAAASQPFAAELAARLPHAHLQPKGLMSTECVVTVPDADGRPILTPHGFFEFERDEQLVLPHELEYGASYSVVATTASGLYRYRTGDLVRCDGYSASGRPFLEFAGRGELASDLVGEKLTEPFVEECLRTVRGFRMLAPTVQGDGYVLATDSAAGADVQYIEERLCANPQYAFARRIGQLRSLRLVEVERLFDRYVDVQLKQGVRLGDIKPLALRRERSWLETLGGSA
jgi:GH3 auxin-responsive promoter